MNLTKTWLLKQKNLLSKKEHLQLVLEAERFQPILRMRRFWTSVNSICVPFVAENSTLPISIAGHNFYCLIDSGAAVTAGQRKSVAWVFEWRLSESGKV